MPCDEAPEYGYNTLYSTGYHVVMTHGRSASAYRTYPTLFCAGLLTVSRQVRTVVWAPQRSELAATGGDRVVHALVLER